MAWCIMHAHCLQPLKEMQLPKVVRGAEHDAFCIVRSMLSLGWAVVVWCRAYLDVGL